MLPLQPVVGNENMADMGDVLVDDPDTEEALAEFDFLVAEQSEGGEARTAEDGTEWLGKVKLLSRLLSNCYLLLK